MKEMKLKMKTGYEKENKSKEREGTKFTVGEVSKTKNK